MGIAARIFLFTPSCVQRFLISWGKFGNRCRVTDAAMRIVSPAAVMGASILDFKARLENRCMVLPVYALLRTSILDFRVELGNRCSIIVVTVENGPPAMAVAATRSASDSILRCRKGEWLACSGRRRNEVPHPILFFVAAKENSFACSSRSGGDLPHPNN